MITEQMDKLIKVGRIGGQIDLLLELKEWLQEKIDAAKLEHAKLGEEINPSVDNIRTTSNATH